MSEAIVIIPARGGSKGIPRKNLRPVNGKPLIYYSINAALLTKTVSTVVVSTDDEEIALFAQRFGAMVIIRDQNLSDDSTIIDPVILDAVEKSELKLNKRFDTVVTVQPTSPLVRPIDIDNAVKQFLEGGMTDTLVSAVDDRHLGWQVDDNNKFIPTYTERVNRQYLPPKYKETGAIVCCNRTILNSGSRFGSSIDLFLMEPSRSFDIDSYMDLALCEAVLRRKRIVFTVTGSLLTGTGHAYRALLLAHEFVHHELVFVLSVEDTIAASIISEKNYNVITTEKAKFTETILAFKPDLVINDILDTQIDYIKKLKSNYIKVVNFEDLGSGTSIADLVINALYPPGGKQSDHVKFGTDYFCLRDEFIHIPDESQTRSENSVLLTFGGVDEGNLTLRSLILLVESMTESRVNLPIDIVVGAGFKHNDLLNEYIDTCSLNTSINIVSQTNAISDLMLSAEFAITSGGRTVLELCATQTPMIVICQNDRETSHALLDDSSGILNLGHRKKATDKEIKNAILSLLNSERERLNIKRKLSDYDLASGKKRVINLIEELLAK